MSGVLSVTGELVVGPTHHPTEESADVAILLEEVVGVRASIVDEYLLSDDNWRAVGLGSLTGAHVVFLKAVGAKAVARLTSAEGSQQLVPVDTVALLISESVPFTAIDVQRTTGIETIVKIFLAERG